MSVLNTQLDSNNVVPSSDNQQWDNSLEQNSKNDILIPKTGGEGILVNEINPWAPTIEVDSSTSKRIIRHPWTTEEDEQLKILVNEMGTNNWHELSNHILNRTARQCRDRWNSYLNPELNLSAWTPDEDNLLLNLYAQLGKKWTLIAQKFPHRTTNSIKNRIKIHSRRIKKEHKITPDPLGLAPIISVPFDLLKIDIKDVDTTIPQIDPTLVLDPSNPVQVPIQSMDNVQIPSPQEPILSVPQGEQNVQ